MRGRRVFAKCETCHNPAPDVPLVGPDLRGVIGRPAGTFEAYKYSRALREAGRTWDSETLDRFLEDPLGYVPGNRMAFAGLKRMEDRQAIICYLEETLP
jgi:cytochrome c